jgi:hypothetical protein
VRARERERERGSDICRRVVESQQVSCGNFRACRDTLNDINETMDINNAQSIWYPETGRRAFTLDTCSEVNALEWKGSLDLVAASTEVIGRYYLRMRHESRPEIDSYPAFGYFLPATNLQLYDNILATAGRDCVRLWHLTFDTAVIEKPSKSSAIKVSMLWSFLPNKEMSWQPVGPTAYCSGTSNRPVFETSLLPQIL